jgi:hypothetical protein
MKKKILIGVLSILELYAATPVVTSPSVIVVTAQPNKDKELAWVDEQILAILPARVGVPDGFVNSLRDPMKMKQMLPTLKLGSNLLAPPKLGSNMGVLAQPKIVEEPLHLLAIMNKSVFINGKWYKIGQSIRDFTLAEIRSNSVLLTGKKDQKLILFLTKQNNNIKIITK